VAEAGHEIGVHGYSHENPIAMTTQQEADVLRKSIDLVEQIAGKRPTGYVAPQHDLASTHLLNRKISLERPPSYFQTGRPKTAAPANL
jgi:peptidoglycan/xylan/chitin deacetylase (PgdA/CDA1 family)